MNARRKICNVLSIISIFAMIWISLAHRPVITSVTATNIDLAAYTLPDGSTPIICFGGEGDGKNTSLQGCPDCTIAGAVIIPERSLVFTTALNEINFFVAPPRTFALPNTISLAGAPPTGPPSFFL